MFFYGPQYEYSEAPGLLLWQKYLVILLLQLFLTLIILLTYLLFLLFPPSLIKLVFGDLARPSRNLLDIQELVVTDSSKPKAVHECKQNVCYSHSFKMEMKVIKAMGRDE